jgi:hypothetical protein
VVPKFSEPTEWRRGAHLLARYSPDIAFMGNGGDNALSAEGDLADGTEF